MKTKIIVTFGPSISKAATLRKVLRHADVARINFSHGDRRYWLSALDEIRGTAAGLGREVALLADLPGPKVRVGDIGAPIHLKKGAVVHFSYHDRSDGVVPVEYPMFYKDARKGAVVDIGDGDARLAVKEVAGRSVVCRSVEEGVIRSRKGISLLGISMSATAPTKGDFELTRFAVKNGFDFVGMSFVRSAGDIRALRRKNRDIRIIAKIEKREAVDNIDEISREADGIMVARGDLAMDVKLEHIPEVQRRIINGAIGAKKPVIVATQLLASMVNNPTPTRAEVNDIANAVISGADCLMLSDETTVGRYPAKAVGFLVNAAKSAERIGAELQQKRSVKITAVNMGIALAAADLADEYRTGCIFIPTQTGTTAKMLAERRPNTMLIALSASAKVRRSLSIYYGLRTLPIKRYKTIDGMLKNVREIALGEGIRSYIVVSGSPNTPGSTDTLKYIGDVHA